MSGLTVGVLALQGDFAEHVEALSRASSAVSDMKLEGDGDNRNDDRVVDGLREVVDVRLPARLDAVDALIIPGGESTTIGKLLVEYRLLEPLRRRVDGGMPVFGTCAGAIVLAKDIGGLDQPLIRAMDIRIRRNAFGRQIQSFETDVEVPALGDRPMRAVFIRAPSILGVGPTVEVLARLDDGTIVAARQGHMLATSFHPELTGDSRFHEYFLWLASQPLDRNALL